MKKIILATALVFVSTGLLIAGDGTTHTGGKTCPPNQTCLTAQVPVESETKTNDESKPIFFEILDYLNKLFR